MLHEKFPQTHLVLANASGTYKTEIDVLINALPAGSFTLIQFENDGPALFNLFDYFVHVPVSRESEAFGQVYIEALFSRIPSVFTLSGIAFDIARNEENCIVVPYKNSDAIFKGLNWLIENPLLSNIISENGYNSVRDSFDVIVKIKKLEKLYASIKL